MGQVKFSNFPEFNPLTRKERCREPWLGAPLKIESPQLWRTCLGAVKSHVTSSIWLLSDLQQSLAQSRSSPPTPLRLSCTPSPVLPNGPPHAWDPVLSHDFQICCQYRECIVRKNRMDNLSDCTPGSSLMITWPWKILASVYLGLQWPHQ
jgi:hypothetical protein